MGQKMLRFWKVTSPNIKTMKLSLALASNFTDLVVNEFDSKSSWFDTKKFSDRIYQKNDDRGHFCLPQVK